MIIGDSIFTSATSIAKGVPSFLSYFKALSNGPPRESNPRPPALQSSALPTELINPAAVNTDDVHLGLGGVSDRDKANF